MTSTNIFSGKTNERNSSRVLRPPGGSNTDVLGLSAQPEVAQEKKFNRRNASSIIEGTNFNMQESNEPIKSHQITEQQTKTVETVQTVATEASTVSSTVNQISRGRVPPGGFSSGLW
jgi:hypothetical protein